jgi:hypothetical protein
MEIARKLQGRTALEKLGLSNPVWTAATLLSHRTFCVHSLHAWAIPQGLMKSIK